MLKEFVVLVVVIGCVSARTMLDKRQDGIGKEALFFELISVNKS